MKTKVEGEHSSDSNIMLESDAESDKVNAKAHDKLESLPTVLSQASLKSSAIASTKPRLNDEDLM